MLNKLRIFMISFAAAFVLLAAPASALVIDIDLNDFFLDGDIVVEPDGSAATITGEGFLDNDPSWGDPGIGVPFGLLSLTFTYEFIEDADDELYVQLWDDDTGDEIAFWFTDQTSADTITLDLSGIDPLITLMGMHIGTVAYAGGDDQLATISNVFLEADDVVIPEPSTFLLLGAGMVFMLKVQRKSIGA